MSVKKNLTAHTIPAIIFDVDGVLVNTVPIHFQAWKRVFHEEGIAFGKKEYRSINGVPRDEGIRIIMGTAATAERIKKIGDGKQYYYSELLKRAPLLPLPGIPRLLHKIRLAGWRLAAASSSKNAADVLMMARLTQYFDVVITGHDFQYPKPDPDIFLTASRILDIESKQTTVVEDAVEGVRAAVAGGFRCVAVATSESSRSLQAAGAAYIVKTTHDLTIDLLCR